MEEQKVKTKNLFGISKKTLNIIAIIAMADVLVMAIPFYLKNVISSEKIALDLGVELPVFSQANAIYGYVALLSYFVGGYFADRISLKKLTFWGLFSVGIVSIWYGFLPFINSGKIAQLYVIFAIWSFLTCFIFWSALWKLLSEQGTQEENGKLNGVHGSLNGIIGTLLIAIAYLVYWLFGTVWVDSLGDWAFSTLVFIFTGFIIINCFLIWFFVPEHEHPEHQTTEFDFHTFAKTLKNYKLWLVTLLIMGVYMYQSGLSVFVTFMDNALGITAIVVVIAGILRTYLFRFFFSAPAGKLADKTQKYILFIIIGLAISTVITTTAIVIPGFKVEEGVEGSSSIIVQVMVILLYLMLGITCWGLVTNRWATIYEINISQKEYAVSVGFISFLAFSPDAWFWQIDSIVGKKFRVPNGQYDDKGDPLYNYHHANQISLAIIVAVGAIAAIGGIILLIALKAEKAKLAKQPTY